MYAIGRLIGVAIVALLAGLSLPSGVLDPVGVPGGAYEWRMLDHDGYAWLARQVDRSGDLGGTLVLTRSATGYDARMTSSLAGGMQPFLVSVVDDRVIVYADTRLGELRLDLPRTDSVVAEWTLRSEEFGESRGRLRLQKRE